MALVVTFSALPCWDTPSPVQTISSGRGSVHSTRAFVSVKPASTNVLPATLPSDSRQKPVPIPGGQTAGPSTSSARGH